jgi:hypothetical protein
MFPFKQFEENDKLIRVFEENIDASELIWHQDREDRTIKVIEANGWGLTIEERTGVVYTKDDISSCYKGNWSPGGRGAYA